LQLNRAKGATKGSFVFYNYFKILPPHIRPASWTDPCEFIPSAPSKNTLAALLASCFLHSFNPSYKGMRIALFNRSLIETLLSLGRFQAREKFQYGFLVLAQCS
jgi:hypothetical protein